MLWLSKTSIEMPDYMWQAMLLHERDVVYQHIAAEVSLKPKLLWVGKYGLVGVSNTNTQISTRIAPALLGLRLQALKISIYDYLPKFHQINVELFLNCYDLSISQ